MDPEETLDLVKDGTIAPDQIDDFENLGPELQELVADGELSVEEASDLQ